MRSITPHGWTIIDRAMPGAPLGGLKEFWFWAIEQGDGCKLTACLLVCFCGGSEGDGFAVFSEVGTSASPVRMVWDLDSG